MFRDPRATKSQPLNLSGTYFEKLENDTSYLYLYIYNKRVYQVYIHRPGVVFLTASLAAGCRLPVQTPGGAPRRDPPRPPPGGGGGGGALLIKDYLSLQGHFPTLS